MTHEEEYFDTCTIINNIKGSNAKPKILVVDITSATQEEIKTIKDAWERSEIPSLIFATSGAKNKQLGAAIAQYGVNKIYFNGNKIKPDEQRKILNIMKKISKGSCSAYSKYVIRDIRNAAFEVEKKKMHKTDSSIDRLTTAENMQVIITSTKEKVQKKGDTPKLN